MKYLVFKTPDESGVVESDAISFEIVQNRLGSDFIKYAKIMDGSEVADKVFDLRINDEIKKEKIIKALELANWSQKLAAEKYLKISPRALNHYCTLWGIESREKAKRGGRPRKSEMKIVRVA